LDNQVARILKADVTNAEEAFAGLDTVSVVGRSAARNSFTSVDTPENEAFIEKWRAFIENPKRMTDDRMAAHHVGFTMWVTAAEKAGTTDSDAVVDATIGGTVPDLSRGYSAAMPKHHLTRPAQIDEIGAETLFGVVWQTPGLVVCDAWPDRLEGSKDPIADRRAPMPCGNLNVETRECAVS
jgi:urea transport system substrate-binding protein